MTLPGPEALGRGPVVTPGADLEPYRSAGPVAHLVAVQSRRTCAP